MHNATMTEIIPAIMPYGMLDLREKCQRVVNYFSLVQIDVMDGVFVPGTTWPYLEGRAAFDRIIRGEEEMPYWDTLNYEIDLMIANPERDMSNWAAAGASRLIVHIESTDTLPDIIAHFGRRARARQDAPALTGPELVLALNIGTDIAALEPYIDAIDAVQCMGIAEIGAQGNPFDARVLSTIVALRTHHPDIIISVDGGVTYDSAPQLIRAGANRLVSGSTIFNAADIEETIHRLQKV